MQEQDCLQQLKNYPSIYKGLAKLSITKFTDFQQQLLTGVNPQLNSMLIIAPQNSGKILGLIVYALRKFINEQQGCLVFVVHSKDLSQTINHLVSVLCKIPLINLYMQSINQQLVGKHIVIGSPLQLQTLTKSVKQKMNELIIIQAQFLLSFGYKQPLQRLIAGLKIDNEINFKISCSTKTAQLQQIKNKYIGSIMKIDYKPLIEQTNEQQQHKNDSQLTHFYQVGDKIMMPISLYVTLRFKLVNPKVLILVSNLKEVYRYFMLLERSMIKNIALYNHENPLNLKFYVLSTWMSGSTNIMIATKQLLKDIQNNIFASNCKKSYKKKQFQLLNLTTIISINLSHLDQQYNLLFDQFQNQKPFIMTFVENNQTEITHLQNLFKHETIFNSIKKKQMPINKKQLEGFRYRINDLYMSINNNKIQEMQEMDLKRKILKSPDLKQYFQQNPKQHQVLVKSINQLGKKLEHNKIVLSEIVPTYLVPECLKNAYEQQLKNFRQNDNGEVPQYLQKVRKVMKFIDVDEQNPETTDPSRLKLISSRKRWKIQHGFKLKKRNLRNQKKGIFETS